MACNDHFAQFLSIKRAVSFNDENYIENKRLVRYLTCNIFRRKFWRNLGRNSSTYILQIPT